MSISTFNDSKSCAQCRSISNSILYTLPIVAFTPRQTDKLLMMNCHIDLLDTFRIFTVACNLFPAYLISMN